MKHGFLAKNSHQISEHTVHGPDSEQGAYHLPLLQLGHILLEDQLSFGFNLGLLPDRVLCK